MQRLPFLGRRETQEVPMVKLSYGLGLLPLAVSANKAKMLSKGIVDVMCYFIVVVQFVLLFVVVRTSNHFFPLDVENNN